MKNCSGIGKKTSRAMEAGRACGCVGAAFSGWRACTLCLPVCMGPLTADGRLQRGSRAGDRNQWLLKKLSHDAASWGWL